MNQLPFSYPALVPRDRCYLYLPNLVLFPDKKEEVCFWVSRKIQKLKSSDTHKRNVKDGLTIAFQEIYLLPFI